MREDMQKIIVERPRYGSTRTNYKSGKHLGPNEIRTVLAENENYDSGPRRASSARRDKWLNENLAPLRRYLHSQIGRPWSKVFSEIRQNLDTRSATGLHVMQHLYQFIAVDTVVIDGVVHFKHFERYGRVKVEGLYVHPKTGLIRYLKPKPRKHLNWRYRDEAPNFVRQSRTSAYEKIEGLWYRLEYGFDEGGLSVLLSKRQCDSKTIRRIEGGEFGAITPHPQWGWPPEQR